MEVVAYLGASTMPVDEALASQLGLASGEGLVVAYVDPKGPASETLQANDVLLKVNDQRLFNQQQFSALIRSFKSGDEVSLSVMRAGKPATLKAKLGETRVPKSPEGVFWMGLPGAQAGGMVFSAPGMGVAPGSSAGAVTIKLNDGAQSTMTMMKGTRQFTLSTAGDGGKQLIVTENGKTVFDGPVNNDEQIGKIPGALRPQFLELQKMGQKVKISAGGEGSSSEAAVKAFFGDGDE